MTPQEHIRYLGISHLVYGSFMSLISIMMMGLFGMMGSMRGGPPVGVLIFFCMFIGVIYGLMTVPSFIAAYGLFKRRSWAKTASIIGAVAAASNFPIGTAVCVYTFWFLFSEPGKAVFDRPSYRLPPGRQAWAPYDVHREPAQAEYAPPPTPPDWR